MAGSAKWKLNKWSSESDGERWLSRWCPSRDLKEEGQDSEDGEHRRRRRPVWRSWGEEGLDWGKIMQISEKSGTRRALPLAKKCGFYIKKERRWCVLCRRATWPDKVVILFFFSIDWGIYSKADFLISVFIFKAFSFVYWLSTFWLHVRNSLI